jgi:putative membrane protein
MPTALLFFRAIHFIGWGMWIGGLFSLTGLLLFRGTETDPEFRLRVARQAKTAAIPMEIGATLAIAGGLYMAFKLHLWNQPWLHMKLALVALLLAYHVYLRNRIRHATKGAPVTIKPFFTPLLGLAVAGIIFIVVFQPFHR